MNGTCGMATSVARILGRTTDEWGGDWEFRRVHLASESLTLFQGWPSGIRRGRGGAGAPRWIVTAPLASLYRSFGPRGCFPAMKRLELPFGENAFKKHRRLLGIDRTSVAEAWWVARLPDLASMTAEAFGREYDVSPKTAAVWRIRLNLPPRRGVACWWSAPENQQLLRSETIPLAWTAEHFGLSVAWIVKLRSMLRKTGIEVSDRRGKRP